MNKVLFTTHDGLPKRVGDAYYCIQVGKGPGHRYPNTIQLVKLENKTRGTSKTEFDSTLILNTPNIKRFHNKKVAKRYLKSVLFIKQFDDVKIVDVAESEFWKRHDLSEEKSIFTHDNGGW